jgi:hypothetical protein
LGQTVTRFLHFIPSFARHMSFSPADGIWKLATRLGFAWRKAQKELYNCEHHDIPMILDELGNCLGRLGAILQPPSQGSPRSKLADARTDVKLLVAHLEKIALPLVGAQVWDLPAPSAPEVHWPATLDLDSCLLHTCEVATQCLDDRVTKLQINLDVARHRETLLEKQLASEVVATQGHDERNAGLQFKLEAAQQRETLLKEQLRTLKVKERLVAPRYDACASTTASSSTCSSPRTGLNRSMTILESSSVVPEGSLSGSSVDLQGGSISGADVEHPEVEEDHSVVQGISAKLATPNADDTRPEGPWLPNFIKHDPCAEEPRPKVEDEAILGNAVLSQDYELDYEQSCANLRHAWSHDPDVPGTPPHLEVCGTWISALGEGRISWEPTTFWHSWEERISDTERLHGFLVPILVSEEFEAEDAVAPLCWQSEFTILEEGQDAGREPHTTETPESECVVHFVFRPGDRPILELRMMSDGVVDECEKVVTFRRTEDTNTEQQISHLRSCLLRPVLGHGAHCEANTKIPATESLFVPRAKAGPLCMQASYS